MEFLLNSTLNILGYLQDWATTTVALLLLVGSMAIYVYSLIDFRVPKLIVAPVVGILTFASAWIYSSHYTAEHEREQCTIRNQLAQEELNRKYLATAIQLRNLQEIYANQRLELEQKHSEERSDLLDVINNLEASEREAKKALESEKTNENRQPTIVYLPSSQCFSTSVPDNILRSINKAGRRDNSSK